MFKVIYNTSLLSLLKNNPKNKLTTVTFNRNSYIIFPNFRLDTFTHLRWVCNRHVLQRVENK